MSSYEHEAGSLEEFDAADREAVEETEAVVLQVVDQRHPATISQLSEMVRAELGEVDNSVIRAAILRLLNGNRLEMSNGRELPAAP